MLAKATEATKALWAKCEGCGHCWPAAYYPIDLMAMGRLLKGCKCPKGCRGKPVLAKQDDGVLQEPDGVPVALPPQPIGGSRMSDADVKMPEPFDYCYEWDGPYGTRKFSVAAHNGRRPDRSVPLYTADQLRAAVLAERERCALICDEQGQEWDSDAVQMLKNYAAHCAAAIREGGNE